MSRRKSRRDAPAPAETPWYKPEFESVSRTEKAWLRMRRDESRKHKKPKGEAASTTPQSDDQVLDPCDDTIGLALSGGGIRSATFNLGLLQALEASDLLTDVDYLSTVSGGGYIGACLTWFRNKQRRMHFPFGTKREDHDRVGGRVMSWLREHGDYLKPGGGLSIWALLAALLTGTIVNLLVIVPVFLLVFFLLARRLPALPGDLSLVLVSQPFAAGGGYWFTVVLVLGALFLLGFVVVTAGIVATSRIHGLRGQFGRRWLHELAGRMLLNTVICALVGTIPFVHSWLMEWLGKGMPAISLSGALSILGALRGRRGGNETGGARAFFLSLGLALLSYGLFLLFYGLVNVDAAPVFPPYLAYGLGVSVILAMVADINHVSMHRYYRDRLMDAYMPHGIRGDERAPEGAQATKTKKEADVEATPDGDATVPCSSVDEGESRWKFPYSSPREADHFPLYELGSPDTDAPYHIIGATVNMVDSSISSLRGRAGDSFFFTPLYYGSGATGFLSTESWEGMKMNLATAFAISGAAVDPNMYATRSRPLSFLMSLLNIRLGYWLENPRRSLHRIGFWIILGPRFSDVADTDGEPGDGRRRVRRFVTVPRFVRMWHAIAARLNWYAFMFAEMFGRGLNEKSRHVHVADGGHFENLGLYELVRRRCKYIVVSDAGADPEWTFKDLGRAIELVRLDFGAEVCLDTSVMWAEGNPDEESAGKRWDKKDCRRQQAFAVGTIDYSAIEEGGAATGCPEGGGSTDEKPAGKEPVDEEPAILLYIKTGVIDDLQEDIYSYCRCFSSDFPDETTVDVSFDERQFEAYRELGYQIGRSLVERVECGERPGMKGLLEKLHATAVKEAKGRAQRARSEKPA